MKHAFGSICGLVLLLFASFLLPAPAQSPALETQGPQPYGYDVTKETTVDGTVSSVLAKASPGMVMGAHLMISTLTGPLDVSLGFFGLRGRGALSVAPGQEVEITGLMKTFKNKPVLLARTIKAGSQSYAIRNEHGIPVSPQARERADQKSTHSGGTQ